MNNFVKIQGYIINLNYVIGIHKDIKNGKTIVVRCVGDSLNVFQFTCPSTEERDILYNRLEDLIKPTNLY